MIGCLLVIGSAGLLSFGVAVVLTMAGHLSAAILYGLAIFLFWWTTSLFRRRRQMLREDDADLTYVDLDDGHVSTVTRDDVDSAGAVSLRPLLERAVRTGETVPLPDDYPREVVLRAAQEGDALVFLILSPFDTQLASVTAVRSEIVSELAWPKLVIQSAAPQLPDQLPVPWCAMTLPLVVIGGSAPEDRPWLAPLAQQLTWCFAKHWTMPRNFRSPQPEEPM